MHLARFSRFPRRNSRHQTLQSRVSRWRGIQQLSKIPEVFCIQAKKHLVEHDPLCLFAGSLKHEIRAVLAQRMRRTVNEITLLGADSQDNISISHGNFPGTSK